MGRQQRLARLSAAAPPTSRHHRHSSVTPRHSSAATPLPSNSNSNSVDDELDLQAFSESLHPIGLAVRDVANDGNCLFRAVSDQLYGKEDHHDELRQRACDYLSRHKHKFAQFVDDELSFDEYVANMRCDGSWGDHYELQALSMECRVNIRLHQPGHRIFDIRNHPAPDAPAIHLSYHFGEHYASVRPLRTANLPVPAQHPSLPSSSATAAITTPTVDAHAHAPSPSRRPRRSFVGNRQYLQTQQQQMQHDVDHVMLQLQTYHTNMCHLADRHRRSARAVRISESSKQNVELAAGARALERDMKDVLSRLDRIGQTVRSVQDMEHPQARRQTDALETALVECAASVERAGARLSDLERHIEAFDRNHPTGGAKQTYLTGAGDEGVGDEEEVVGQGRRSMKGGRKKEQMTRKKERKERRKREQERIARESSNHMAPPLPTPLTHMNIFSMS